MREILFRGKRTDNGEWEYGDLWCNPYGKRVVCIVSPINDQGTTGGNEVDPETVGQYTGLKDKNGNRIFDGDVVWFSDEKERGVVYFDNSCARFAVRFDTFDAAFDHLYSDELEIIGNSAESL